MNKVLVPENMINIINDAEPSWCTLLFSIPPVLLIKHENRAQEPNLKLKWRSMLLSYIMLIISYKCKKMCLIEKNFEIKCIRSNGYICNAVTYINTWS